MGHSTVFVQQQNLIRGALSNLRKRGYVASGENNSLLVFRTALRRALIRARASLDIGEYGEFLEWYERLRVGDFGSRIEKNIGYDYLNGIIDGPIVPLHKEVAWIVARIALESETLRAFRVSASKLDALCVSGSYEAAINELAELVVRYGESMWSVQLRLALEQRHHGLEAQKAYLEIVRKQYRHGILSYVAYNTSVRNEERTSWQRFADGVRSSSARRANKPLADYLNYRLLNLWPENAQGLANVLRLEQSHSIVDIYETYVGLSQLAEVRPDLEPLRPALRVAAQTLSHVDDFRLLRIAGSPLPFSRTASAPKGIAQGRLTDTVRAAGLARRNFADPWTEIYAAASYALAERERKSATNLFGNSIVRVLSLRGNTATDADELAKLCHNFAGLPIAQGVMAFLNAIYAFGSDGGFRFTNVSLNSPVAGQEDFVGLGVVLDEPSNIDPAAPIVADAIKSYCTRAFESAQTLLSTKSETISTDAKLLQRLFDLLSLKLADMLDELGEAVSIISRMGSNDPSVIPLLAIPEILGGRSSKDFKALSGRLETLNALNMLWKIADDESAASTLKLMTGHLLRTGPRRRPSQITEADFAVSRAELIYFLREVCVPNVLDVSRVFEGSRDVMEERQAICSALHTLDPLHADQYAAEVSAITRRLKVDEGLKIVDQSRIHVDTDAVTRWARRNLREDFDRYVDLVEAGIGAPGKFDDALREVMEAIRSAKSGEFFTPKNEADTALVRILKTLSEEFLNSSTFGLDYFLSKRIRHVSFIGLVRGPLEFSHLIANKPTAQADYRSNEFWLDRLSTLNEENRSKVDLAIKGFSKTYDQAVNRLKDEIFHVNSSEHPNGIFYIPLTTTMLTLARALLNETDSFEDFLDSVYIIFWAVLEASLTKARRIIDDELKMQIAHAMDELKAEIGLFAHDDGAFPELSAALAQAGTEVQSALSVASSWFTRPEIREVMRYFTLEESLEVAIESALKLHKGFCPEIVRKVEGDISLSAPDLVFITDAILIAFSNIKAYSKLEEPKVEVSLSLDGVRETLTVEIVNDVHPTARSASQDRQIAEIEEFILSGVDDKMSRSEGGSGFVKLAAVAHQSTKGRVEFGYIERTRFRLSVTYSILLDTANVGERP